MLLTLVNFYFRSLGTLEAEPQINTYFMVVIEFPQLQHETTLPTFLTCINTTMQVDFKEAVDVRRFQH